MPAAACCSGTATSNEECPGAIVRLRNARFLACHLACMATRSGAFAAAAPRRNHLWRAGCGARASAIATAKCPRRCPIAVRRLAAPAPSFASRGLAAHGVRHRDPLVSMRIDLRQHLQRVTQRIPSAARCRHPSSSEHRLICEKGPVCALQPPETALFLQFVRHVSRIRPDRQH